MIALKVCNRYWRSFELPYSAFSSVCVCVSVCVSVSISSS